MFKLGYRKFFCYVVLILMQYSSCSRTSKFLFGVFQQNCVSQQGPPAGGTGAAVLLWSSLRGVMDRREGSEASQYVLFWGNARGRMWALESGLAQSCNLRLRW